MVSNNNGDDQKSADNGNINTDNYTNRISLRTDIYIYI